MSFPHAAWLSDDHALFAKTARRFVEAEITAHLEAHRKAGIVPREVWAKAADAGILGATIPEAYGGAGCPDSFDLITMYEQGRGGDSGWGFAIQTIVSHYIQAYATEAQKERWLPKLASGEHVAAIAMSEPGTGSDLQNVQTFAARDGDFYRLTGAKTFITNGQTADLICVVAKTDRSQGAQGTSLLMVETEGLEGFKRGRNLEKLGMKSADTSELFFEDCKVPTHFVLGGKEGQGFFQLMLQLPFERLAIGVLSLGAIDCAIEHTLAYTRERKAFGKPISRFQNSRFKLAEVKTKAEVLRSFLADCIGRQDLGKLDAATASMAKWWGSEIQGEIIDECLQLFGGYGFMMEYPIAHLYADARAQRIYGGTNEIMKELVARSLKL
ncbi:MAG: acyl-CoA dehydrogenase family protein [Myxococcota bacterium]